MNDDDDWNDDDDILTIIAPAAKKRRKQESHEDKLYKRLKDSALPSKAKNEALRRFDTDDSNRSKTLEWIENLLRIPFNVYYNLPVTKTSKPATIEKFLTRAETKLNDAVYGMNNVKEEVMNYIAQFISTDRAMPRILGLCGSPGIGKTAIIRKGFAQAINRPIRCFSMGGIRDSNYFLGHDYTYTGSRYGAIIQALIDLKCMNGVIYFDEIDKISYDHEGRDIHNLLIHVTDPMQNGSFQDKYFNGINIDLSQIIFVFSFNDESLIDPILRDRIYTIHVQDPSDQDKVVIAQKYLMKEISCNVGFKFSDIVLPIETVQYILNKYCKEQKGVRTLKKCLQTILLKINLARYLGEKQKRYKTIKNIKLPINISVDIVNDLLSNELKEDKYILSMYM